MHRLLDPAARERIQASVEAVERSTCAECVVVVERRAGTYATPRALLGISLAVLCQLFLLFAEAEYPLDWFVIMPLVAGLVGALIGSVGALQRRLTPAPLRRQRVLEAAQAAFYRHRVGHTRDHVGVLIYLALTEGQVEVVADTGVLKARPLEAWERAVASLDQALAGGGEPERIAAALSELGELLARCLPVGEDDVDELTEEVLFG